MLFHRRVSRHALLALLLCSATSIFSQTPVPPALGSVEGVVLDDDGKPVENARVYGLPVQNMLRRLSTTADAQGNFVLTSLPPGDVYLHAYKESDGYPDNFFAFYKTTDRSAPRKFTVGPGMPVRGVVITLGLKAAYLRFEITNQEGMPLNAGLIFTRDDMQGTHQRGISAPETIMVPPVPFRLAVEVQGYEPWHYGGRDWQGKAGLIDLKPGQSADMRIQLRRSR